MKRKCLTCHEEFEPKAHNSVYCTESCRYSHSKATKREKTKKGYKRCNTFFTKEDQEIISAALERLEPGYKERRAQMLKNAHNRWIRHV